MKLDKVERKLSRLKGNHVNCITFVNQAKRYGILKFSNGR